MRKHLFSDMRHIGPEPPWRTVGDPHAPSFAVRGMPSYPPHRLPSYALRATGADGDADAWEFTVMSDPMEPPVVHRILVASDGEHALAEIPGMLREDGAAQLQRGYGFRTLGHTPHLR